VALGQVIEELAMNALVHGGGGGMVEVDVAASGWSVVVRDSGRGLSDELLGDEGRWTGSGLASVRRLASRLELSNPDGGGARVAAHRDCGGGYAQLSDAGA
jgi:signal transduction histidine kinase